MGRVGEGFNLARVNQASLIDEPARRAERGMSVHGPLHRYGLYVRAMGGRDGRNRRAGIVRVPGYLPIPSRPWSRGPPARLATYLRALPTGSGFPAEAKYPSTTGTPLPTKVYIGENGRQAMR